MWARCVAVELQHGSTWERMLTPRARSTYCAEEEGSCSARWRRSCSPNSAVAVSGGDGEMLGLHSCLACGCRDAAPAPAPASLRSQPRRVLRQLERRGQCKRRKRCRTGDERRYACSPGGEEASWVSRSVRHRLLRPPGRVRSGYRRTRSSRECTASSGELPRPCVAGAGRAEISSARRKRTVNVGRSLGHADELVR